MKFRLKVLFINIIIMSLALGCSGYLMINRNFRLAYDTQIQNAVEENNFIQASVEYHLLEIIFQNERSLSEALPDIGAEIYSSIMATSSTFFLLNNGITYYSSQPDIDIPEQLFYNIQAGTKNYYVTKELDEYQIYVISMINLDDDSICIVSRKNISNAYTLKDKQLSYFKWLILAILLVSSAIMYLLSYILTKPIEQLDKISDEFASGNYDVRSTVHTKDEIGTLSTKFNHLAETVSSHIKELNNLVRQREQFVADFTHEIKTPMTSIIGYADTIRSKELSRENQIMAADYIFSEGKRLEALSMKLFDLIYLNQNEIILAPLYTEKLGMDISKIAAPILSGKNISLNGTFEDAIITGDAQLLQTAFLNLIDNARKASKPGDSISFSGVCRDDTYVFEVTDFGIGMEKEHLEHIFDEFYMVDKSRSRREGGAGLGLSLTALIMEKHHAQILIDSEIHKGTKFTVVFQKGGNP